MKVLFVCRKFDKVVGGVERMSIAMMNDLVARGHQAALLTFDQTEADPHYPLNPEVEWVRLAMGNPDIKASWRLRWQRQASIRAHVKRIAPDVIIGFQNGAFLVVRTAVAGLGIPVVAAERNAPSRYDYLSFGWRKQIDFLAFLLASRVTVQLPSYIRQYPFYLRSRMVALPNPVAPAPDLIYPNEQAEPSKIIVNVGRLSHQKNQSFLLRAFARVLERHPDWRLAIVGDGEKNDEVRRTLDALKIHENVLLVGAVKDVSAWYNKAAFLAFPSLWEGFPNALAEAFSHGLPAVGLQTTAGVNELIVEGQTGFLSEPTEEAFAACMSKMIEDLPGRQRMGRTAVQAMQFYAPTKIFDQWEGLFRSLSGVALPLHDRG